MITKRNLIGIFGFIVSLSLVTLLFLKIDIKKSYEIIKEVKWYVIPLMIAIYLSTFLLRAKRWQLMLMSESKIPTSIYFKSLIIGFGGNNILPARGGELLRMEFYNKIAGEKRIKVLTSILSEKILDGLILVLFLICSLYFLNLFSLGLPWLNSVLKLSTTLFLVLFIAIVLISFYGNILNNLLRQHFKNENRFIKVFDSIFQATKFLNNKWFAIYIILLSFIIWLIESSLYIFILYYFKMNISYIWSGIFVMAIVNFGILIPSSPGYIGVFQSMFILALSIFGIDVSQALTASVIVHSAQFIPVTIWFISLIYIYNKKIIFPSKIE